MPQRHTVRVVDTEGDEELIKRESSYKSLESAVNAVETLSEFVNFETERLELDGGDSITAWLDELESDAEDRDRTDHYWVPQEGDLLNDTDAPKWSKNNRENHVEVTEVTDIPASEYYIERNGGVTETTVKTMNPTEPDDAPVVLGRYVEGSDKEYAFPVTRLEQT